MVCVWLAHIRVRAGSVGGFCALSRRTGGGGGGVEGGREGGKEEGRSGGVSTLQVVWDIVSFLPVGAAAW